MSLQILYSLHLEKNNVCRVNLKSACHSSRGRFLQQMVDFFNVETLRMLFNNHGKI